MALALYDGFHFFKFCIAAVLLAMAFASHSAYKDAVSDYNLSQTDFRAYQQKIISAEDARKAEAARIEYEVYWERQTDECMSEMRVQV